MSRWLQSCSFGRPSWKLYENNSLGRCASPATRRKHRTPLEVCANHTLSPIIRWKSRTVISDDGKTRNSTRVVGFAAAVPPFVPVRTVSYAFISPLDVQANPYRVSLLWYDDTKKILLSHNPVSYIILTQHHRHVIKDLFQNVRSAAVVCTKGQCLSLLYLG